jgi:hypothetical protein
MTIHAQIRDHIIRSLVGEASTMRQAVGMGRYRGPHRTAEDAGTAIRGLEELGEAVGHLERDIILKDFSADD